MVRRGPPSAYAALIFWAGTPGICAYESRGIDTTLMRRCRGSKLTSINVSDREYGSTRRRSSMVESIPMTRTLTRCFRRNGQPNGRMAAGGVSALVVLVNALPCVVKYRATPAAAPTKSIGQAIHGHRGGTSHLRGVVRRRAAPGRSGPAVGVSSCGLMVSGSKGMAPQTTETVPIIRLVKTWGNVGISGVGMRRSRARSLVGAYLTIRYGFHVTSRVVSLIPSPATASSPLDRPAEVYPPCL